MISSYIPVEPQIPASEENGDSISDRMMYPTLLEQLSHPGVDEGVTRQAILPLFQLGVVLFPRDLQTNGIIDHFVIFGIEAAHSVEIFSPNELTRYVIAYEWLVLVDLCENLVNP